MYAYKWMKNEILNLMPSNLMKLDSEARQYFKLYFLWKKFFNPNKITAVKHTVT